MNEKGDLNDKQQAFIRRKQSTLARLNNPFPRPSKPLYQGQAHILVGVALGLDKPATAAVVDVTTGKAITYRSVKQLLGDHYELLNKQRQRKQQQSHQRHKAQSDGRSNQFGDSELGEYVDRLLAKTIVTFAQTYHAASIVLPKLGDMRELVQSEIQSRAEQKIPGYIEGQEKYAKQYRVSVHQWSYGRLIDNIRASAAKLSIVVEEGQQPIRGSPQEKAKEMAISAYRDRFITKT
jgi:transposase